MKKRLKKFILDTKKNVWVKKIISLFLWSLLFEMSRGLKKKHPQSAIRVAEFAWEGFIISACMILLLSPGIASFIGITFPIMTTNAILAQSLFLGLWIAVVFSEALVFTGLFFLPKFPRWLGICINKISVNRNYVDENLLPELVE